MKFLCVSDQIDALVYSTTVKERYGDVDAVFCAGDLSMEYVDYIVSTLGKPTYFVFGNHNLEEFRYYKKGASANDTNYNDTALSFKHSHGGDYAGNKVIASKNLTITMPDGKKTPLLIAGISGSRRYNNGQCQYTERQMKSQLIALVPKLIMNKIRYGRYLDIFLTHASPRHIHDREDPCHKGFKCFNWFIEKFSPALMIHGHIHLYDMQATRHTKAGNTHVVNAFSHIIIELNTSTDNPEGDEHGRYINVFQDR